MLRKLSLYPLANRKVYVQQMYASLENMAGLCGKEYVAPFDPHSHSIFFRYHQRANDHFG